MNVGFVEEESMKKSTRYAYERYSRLYMDFQGSIQHSAESIINWLDYLVTRSENTYSPSSLWPISSHVLKFIKLRFNVKIDKERIHNHVKALSKHHRSKKSEAFSSNQIFTYLLQHVGEEDCFVVEKLYILFSFFTAARISEMVNLLFSDICDAGNDISIEKRQTQLEKE